MQRILVLRGGAIGDFLLTLPAIKLLREAWPQARLEIIGYPHITALAEKRYYADAVRSIESRALAPFFAEAADPSPDMVDYFGNFDLVVSYLFDPEKIFERNVGRCGVRRFLCCSPRICAGEHAARQLARPLENLELFLLDHAAQLFLTPEDRKRAEHCWPGESTMAVHPGSGSTEKNWPLGHWIELLERLCAARPAGKLLLIGGEADENRAEKLHAIFRERSQLAKQWDLVTLAAVLERCELFLGHDSGISHIAAAVGTRSLLLFGPTNPDVWAPANRNVQVIRSQTGTMADIALASVEEAANAILSARN